MGAYLSALGPLIPTQAAASAMGGVYAIPAICMDVRGAFTNSVPVDAYRGAGKPEANYLIERLVEIAAARIGMPPMDLRRLNMMADFPYRSALGMTVERGAFAAHLDTALTLSDQEGFRGRRAEAARRGAMRGLGFGCYLETARGRPGEFAGVQFEADGTVSLLVGTQSNGQGHETSFSQIAADLLGLPIERFRLVQADTRRVPSGKGHGGARSLHQGGAALVAAIDGVLAMARVIAGQLLQSGPRRPRLRRRHLLDPRARPNDRPRVRRRRRPGPGAVAARRRTRPRLQGRDPARPRHLPQRLPCGRGRDRPRNGVRDAGALHCRRRLRNPRQPIADGGPGAGRRRARHRTGPSRAYDLRCLRPTPHGLLHGTTDCRVRPTCPASSCTSTLFRARPIRWGSRARGKPAASRLPRL